MGVIDLGSLFGTVGSATYLTISFMFLLRITVYLLHVSHILTSDEVLDPCAPRVGVSIIAYSQAMVEGTTYEPYFSQAHTYISKNPRLTNVIDYFDDEKNVLPKLQICARTLTKSSKKNCDYVHTICIILNISQFYTLVEQPYIMGMNYLITEMVNPEYM